MPSSARWTRSASWPTTTINGSTPAAAARLTTRRTSGSPSSSMKSLFCPMRVDVPAASTTPATDPVRSEGMDGLALLSKVDGRLSRQHREQLRDDADGDLLGTVGAEAQADGREDTWIGAGVVIRMYLLGARARTEQPDVRRAALEKVVDPITIVLERMCLHDDERACVDPERFRVTVGSHLNQARRGKTIGG